MAGRSRGSTFAGFTAKVREKISAKPQDLSDPKVRSEFAKEAQPAEVNFNAGETFKDVTKDKKPVTLKMTRAGILTLDPVTNNVVGDEYLWVHIADFRVGKNKKTFAIMHDVNKDGSKLQRVEWKSADTVRMLGTATKFVDVLAAEMNAKAQTEVLQHKTEKTTKKKKKSSLAESHSPRDTHNSDEASEDADDKPKKKKASKKKKAKPAGSDSDNDADSDTAPADKSNDSSVEEEKPKPKKKKTTKKTAEPGSSTPKKKKRSRAQTTI